MPSWQTSIKWVADDGTEVKRGDRVIELDNTQFTSGLDAKYKTVVDQAIKDMQKVVDDLKTVITNMTTAAQTASTADAAKAKAQSDKAKELRAKDKETRKHGALNRAKGEGQDSTDK